MDIRIRTATDVDIQPLAVLSRKTITASYSSFLGEPAVKAYIASGAVDRYVTESIDHALVVDHAGSVVGFSVTKENLIDLMMIDVGYHRRGLGAMLLRHVESTLFQDYETLRLESFRENAPANAFYEKNGWIAIRTFGDEESGFEKIEFQKSRPRDPNRARV